MSGCVGVCVCARVNVCMYVCTYGRPSAMLPQRDPRSAAETRAGRYAKKFSASLRNYLCSLGDDPWYISRCFAVTSSPPEGNGSSMVLLN